MDLIQSIADLINEDPNFAAQSQLTIDKNAQSNDTSLINKTLDKNQQKSEAEAKKNAAEAQRANRKLANQFKKYAKASHDAAKINTVKDKTIEQIAHTMDQAANKQAKI